jgi:hypothetical protein
MIIGALRLPRPLQKQRAFIPPLRAGRRFAKKQRRQIS